MRKIIDEFTDLPLWPSRKCELRKSKRGLCTVGGCSNKAGYTLRCDDHAEAEAIRKRNLYRRCHGIPLNAPPYTRAKKNE